MKEKIKFREKLAYAVGDGGCNIIWSLVGSYLTFYYTDSVGISAAAVGTLMLLARVLDGISDLLMGSVIDRTKTRWGKARPWLLFSAPFMMIGLILLFSVPGNLPENGKLAYAYVTYIFLAVIVYTACNLSYVTLLSLWTDDLQVRTVASSIRFFICILVMIASSYITNPLVSKIGWTSTSIIFGMVGMILILITFFGTRERVTEQKQETEQTQERQLVDLLKNLIKNKYFFIVTLIFVMLYSMAGMMNGVGIYYARDILGNMNYFGTLSLFRFVPSLIASMMMPRLVEKYGKWKILMVGFLLVAVSFGMNALAPRNIPVVLFALVIWGVGQTAAFGLVFPFVADVVDYGEWKTGIRIDGLTYSSVSFGMKVGTGLGSAVVGWFLDMGGYNATAAVQSESALNAIIALYTWMPCVVMVLGLVLLGFANMDKVRKMMDAKGKQ